MSDLTERLRIEIATDDTRFRTFNASKSEVKQLCLMYEEMEKVMGQIAEMKRKTKEQRLAYSCLTFLNEIQRVAP